MSGSSTNSSSKPLEKRARNSVPLALELSKETKRLAAAILEVLAGVRTPQQAAEALQLSVPRYYQLEARGLRGLLEACVPKAKGRQPNPLSEMAALRRQIEHLQRELSRQQTLVRMAQRTVGLNPPAAPAPKTGSRKSRKRKPAARALSMAARLTREAAACETPGDNALSPTSAV
jgi:hypothetical protein